MTYNLHRNREIAWHQGSENLNCCFNHAGAPYLHERDIGLFQANDKHTCQWFHVSGDKESLLHKELQAYGMEWGHRLYNREGKTFLIGAATIIMPYNYQNIVQHFRNKTEDIGLENFYASDMYLLDGEIPMHKFKTNPEQLEMMLDQYWKQDPFSILSCLIKTATPIE